MLRRAFPFLASGIAALLATLEMLGVAAADSITYSDAIFDNAHWSQQVLFENYISQSFSSGQEPTGGMPDAYRRNHLFGDETTNNGGVGPAGATVGHFWSGPTWNPAAHGEVSGLMFAMDAVAFDDRPTGQTVPTGVQVAAGFLLRQGGVVYIRNPTTNFSGPNGVWSSLTYSAFSPTAFTRFDEQPDSPDFSTSGGPIEFGYYTRASATFPFINNHFGVDNFAVTVSTPGPIIPEPNILILLAHGSILAAISRRPSRRAAP
jgi:hypothetical protein